MKYTASAPGKLVLLGEHAVVYGYPCISVALGGRIYVRSIQSSENKDQYQVPKYTNNSLIKFIVAQFKKRFKINKKVTVVTNSTFTDQLGLGSSAATIVAVTASLIKLFSISQTKNEFLLFCLEINRKYQGIGSGVDIATAVFGGIIYYQIDKDIEFLPIGEIKLIVGYTGVKVSTSEILHDFRINYLKKKKQYDEIFTQISQLSIAAKKFLKTHDYKNVGSLMNENHKLLQKLGVSTPKLDELVFSAISAGAWGAKLSGAGKGDCMLAIAPKKYIQNVKEAINAAGGQVVDVFIEKQGVEIKI